MVRPHRCALRVERLEDRETPANLTVTGVTLVDVSNAAQANPVYGQMIYVRANWAYQALSGSEPALPVRYTVNYAAGYFSPGSAAVSYPADSPPIANGGGSGSRNFYRGGWYAGTASFSVTVTVDPDNQVVETDETDNATTITVTPVAPADLPNRFLQPVGRQMNRDWAIANYADIDPRAGLAADFRGGMYQYDGHDAIDAQPWGFDSMDAGLAVFAAADGTVTEAADGNFDRQTAQSSAPGNQVRIAHGNGWETVYAHFAANSVVVKVGDTVKAGQLLALVGSSGNSTGAHLHYTAYYRGCQVEAGFAPASYWVTPPPYASDVAAFTFAAGVTNYDPGADGDQEKVSAVGAFPTAGSATLSFWVQTYNLRTTDTLTWQWYRPNGTLAFAGNLTPAQAYRFAWIWQNVPLSSFQPALGTWQVAYLINGAERNRVGFVVNATGEPSLRLAAAGDAIVIDGRTTPMDFGSAAQSGSGPQRSFTVSNHGYGDLALGAVVVPPGFSVIAAPTTIAAGGTATLTLALNTAVVGAKYGTVRFDTNDPDIGTFEFAVAGTVTGSAAPGAPVVGLAGNPAAAYNFTSLPRLLSPTATVTDADSANFAGGTLTVEFAAFAAAEDRLGVSHQGTGPGQIGVSGSTVTYGVAIATFTGGVGTTPLAFTLNASATPAATQALLRRLTYQNVSATATTQRKAIRYTLADGTGNVSNLAVQHVVNSGVARNPAVATLPPTSVPLGTAYGAAGSFADPWGTAWTATVDYGDGSGVQPLALNADKTFALSRTYAAAGTYTVTVAVSSDIGGTTTATASVTVVAAVPPRVSAVAANPGSAQRSRVTSVAVTFDAVVTFAGPVENAFQLSRVGGGAVGGFTAASVTVGGVTVVTLTNFTGAETVGGSLVDGRYAATVVAAQVSAGGSQLDGDGNGNGGDNYVLNGTAINGLFRYYGDLDGDGDVDGSNLVAFVPTLFNAGGYNPAFDFDGDGDVDGTDLFEFVQNLFVPLP